VDAAIPCFIASLYSVLPLVEALLPADILGTDSTLEEAIDLYKDRGVLVLPPEVKRGVQKEWEAPLHDLTMSTQRVTATTPTDRRERRCLASHSPVASARDSPLERVLSCRLRLGADTCVPHR